jgi:hypothetical protein
MNVFDLPVHPHADIFPMLSEAELSELANDIAENGLREPLVLQVVEGVDTLIDGRNRRAACALVHVEPGVRYLNGEDPTAYIFSTNIARRHLTAGQRAMLTGIMYPEGEKGGRGKHSTISGELSKYEQNILSQARAVLRHPDLVSMVMAGKSLNDAYETAKAKERDADAYGDAVAFLEKHAPDFAVLVREENKSPFEMRRKFEEAASKRKLARLGLWTILSKVETYLSSVGEDHYSDFDAYFAEAPEECEADIAALASSMAKFAKYLKTKVTK